MSGLGVSGFRVLGLGFPYGISFVFYNENIVDFENSDSQYCRIESYNGFEIVFKDPNKAMLFKLTWM